MRWSMPWLLVVLACTRTPETQRQPQLQNEFDSFERAFAAQSKSVATQQREAGREIPGEVVSTSYRAVFIGRSGIYIDRKLVATLAEIDTKRDVIVAAIAENATLMPTVGLAPTVTFDLASEPANVAISTMRLFAGRQTMFYQRIQDPKAPERAHDLFCDATVHAQPSVDKEAVNLSVLLAPEQTWVGLSRIDEFQQLPHRSGQPDLAKLETTLKEHKATAFFTNRTDLEVAAESGTSLDVIGVLGTACRVGFVDLAVLERGQLTAAPRL